MPRTEIDYSKSCFYKIVCNDHAIKDLYVGLTTDFRRRKNEHKTKCNNPNSNKYNLNVYQFIRANGGWNNWSMVLTAERHCVNSLEARAIEREYYDLLGSTLNGQVPNRTKHEYIVDNGPNIYRYQNADNTCECGGCFLTKHKARHLRTTKHKQYLESIAQDI